jgi:histidinol-phosphatase
MGGVTVLEAMIGAARAAGEVALRYYRGGFDVVIKDDRTPVTQADREAEQLIVERLRRVFPDCGFLGEEFGDSGPKDRRFIIDPIDGTKNFVRGIPVWATLLALEEGGEVTAGVVHNPALGEMFWARRGGGAFRNGERVSVSGIVRLGEAQLIHSALRPLRAAGYWEGFARLVDATDRQRGFGDYMGYTLVAEGKAEIYAEIYSQGGGLKPWDLAPCKILVEEAGGIFTDLDGCATIYTGSALATNGHLHEAALGLLRPS